MKAPFTVAVDGPAAAGKGTISKAIARHFGLAHLDTGLLYRAVGARMLEGDDPETAARALTPGDLERSDLRTPGIARAASKVAVLPSVRAALLDYQRAFARRSGGAVLDGRDIGTVICPQAEIKLFVTASTEVRANRRLAELRANGHQTDLETVIEDIRARDASDSDRAAAPLKPALDAVVLDTSDLSIQDAVEKAVSLVALAR